MAAFNSVLQRAMRIPMTKENRQVELNYTYETARLNGYAGEPIEIGHQTQQRATHQADHHYDSTREGGPVVRHHPKVPQDYQQGSQHRQATCEVGFHKRKKNSETSLGHQRHATTILKKSGIYELTYETCNAMYVGTNQTDRHKRAQTTFSLRTEKPRKARCITYCREHAPKRT
jgi:hypothetical protein